MSNIAIHRIADIARRHSARVQQLEAMPPGMLRGEFDFWDLNRPGYAHGYRPQPRARLRGPVDGLGGGGGDVGPARPPPSAELCLRTKLYVVYLNDANMATNVYLTSSSETVPFRFRIGDISLNQLSHSGGGFASWNAFIGYEEHLNARLTSPPSGEPVFRLAPATAGLLIPAPARLLGPHINGFAADSQVPYRGGGPYNASQRIIICATVQAGGPANFEQFATIEVIECPEEFTGGGGVGDGGGGGPPPPPPPGGGGPPPPWDEVF